MSESNGVRIGIAIRLDMSTLSDMDPVQSKAILDGIADLIASGHDAADAVLQGGETAEPQGEPEVELVTPT